MELPGIELGSDSMAAPKLENSAFILKFFLKFFCETVTTGYKTKQIIVKTKTHPLDVFLSPGY